MAEKKSRWYENIWLVTIGGGIAATAIGTLVYDKVKDKPILSTFWGWIVMAGHGIVSSLNYQLKVWWIPAAIVCIILLLLVIAYFQRDTPEDNHQPIKPPFADYVEDRFSKWTWRWDWQLKNDGWDVINLTPYCEKCDTPIQEYGDFFSSDPMCPRCKVRTYPKYSEGTKETKVLILDNVRKKYPQR
jgi:hypothetical protein